MCDPARTGPSAVGEALAELPDPAREYLERELRSPGFDGHVGGSAVRELLGLDPALTRDDLLSRLLVLARDYARPPTSDFRVGAVAEGATGSLYLGANLELPNQALGFTLHAEQSAVLNAFAHEERSLVRLAATAAPCGHCRQFLNELPAVPSLEVRVGGEKAVPLSELLPSSFGPEDLGVERGMLGQPESSWLAAPLGGDPLIDAAARAAARSYAPYTGARSGVALRTIDGVVTAGAYLENAAYNPSVPPVIAALDRQRFRGVRSSDVVNAALVEVDGSAVEQGSLTRLVLEAVAPGATLEVVGLRRPGD